MNASLNDLRHDGTERIVVILREVIKVAPIKEKHTTTTTRSKIPSNQEKYSTIPINTMCSFDVGQYDHNLTQMMR